MAGGQLPNVAFLGFDVYGTVVDWRSGVARESERFLNRHRIEIDPFDFADEWRSLYEPSMEKVRSGGRPWVPLRVLNRESLEVMLKRHGVDVAELPAEELTELNRSWERLDPWPDSVEGLRRLRTRFAIGPLSNGDIAGMMRLARFASLPWDVITGAELTRSYKPVASTYVGSAQALDLLPSQVAMVAAHNTDLQAAKAAGLRTIFILRRQEHGAQQTTDLEPCDRYDVVAGSLIEAADILGCTGA